MKVIGYVRVLSEGLAAVSSRDKQESVIEDFAKLWGLNLTQCIVDGASVDEKDIHNLLINQEADVVLVTNIDRITSDENEFERAVCNLIECEKLLISCRHGPWFSISAIMSDPRTMKHLEEFGLFDEMFVPFIKYFLC